MCSDPSKDSAGEVDERLRVGVLGRITEGYIDIGTNVAGWRALDCWIAPEKPAFTAESPMPMRAEFDSSFPRKRESRAAMQRAVSGCPSSRA